MSRMEKPSLRDSENQQRLTEENDGADVES